MNDLMRICGFMIFIGGLVKIPLDLLAGRSKEELLIGFLVCCFGLSLHMLGFAIMRIDELHESLEKTNSAIKSLEEELWRHRNARSAYPDDSLD